MHPPPQDTLRDVVECLLHINKTHVDKLGNPPQISFRTGPTFQNGNCIVPLVSKVKQTLHLGIDCSQRGLACCPLELEHILRALIQR